MTARRGRLRTLLAAAAVGSLLLSGCGDDTDAGAAPATDAGAEDAGTTSADAEASTEASEASGEVVVEHAQGETTVPVDPDKVITFDLSVLDTLNELDVEVAGVPKSNLPEFLSQYEGEEYLDAGTLFEPDYEAVAAAEPDLIIVAGRSSEAYGQLAEIAPTIDLTVDQSNWFESFSETTMTLAEIFQEEEEAAAALADIEADVEATREQVADAGTGLIVLTTGGEVTAYGPGSRFGMLHDLLGVAPAVPDVEEASHGEAISFEFIREANPDWLFVIDRDSAIGEDSLAAEQVLDNELVADTTAWSSDQVVYLDPVRWYIVTSGLTSVEAMIEQIQSEVA